jgi:tight adherence protein B
VTILARLLPVALAAALLAGVAVAPARTADASGVQVVEAGTALFPDRAYILTLPERPAKPLTTDDVTVTEDGTPVEGLAVASSASASGIGTVLLIDASNSMKGSINAAMEAARAFVARNPGQPISVVFFNSRPKVALPLTTNKEQIDQVLAKAPPLGEGTQLYDALAAAVAQIRGSSLGAARIVLLSDGDDVGSLTTLDSALSQLEEQRTRVFTVGIESPAFNSADLERIAGETGGSYAAASSPEALKAIYDQLGFELGNEYLIRYRSNARPDQQVDVEITLKGAEPVSFTYESPSAGSAQPYAPAFWDELIQSPVLMLGIALAVLGLVVLTLRALWGLRSNKKLVSRLGDFVTLPAEERAAARRKEVDHVLAVASPEKKRREFRWLEGFAEDVDVAQIDRNPTRMLILSAIGGIVLAVVASVLIGPFWIVLAVVPPVVLNLVVRTKANHVRNEFGEQLPENLDVLASALRAGHSLAGAMGVVADEAPEPSKREFSRVVTDEQLGIPLDEALEVTGKRMQNSDIDQVAILALVQREAGGNTAEVLDQVTKNIRARMDVRRLVKVLTAQGKFSSVVIALVPLGIFVFLILVNPSHLDPLFHEPVGQVASVGAILMLGLGFLVIRKIISIEL